MWLIEDISNGDVSYLSDYSRNLNATGIIMTFSSNRDDALLFSEEKNAIEFAKGREIKYVRIVDRKSVV